MLAYTRTPLEGEVYSPKLAFSMHLAVSEDGTAFAALNNNSGVLFARATSNEDGTLNAKGFKQPYVFHRPEGGFGIAAIRTNEEGAVGGNVIRIDGQTGQRLRRKLSSLHHTVIRVAPAVAASSPEQRKAVIMQYGRSGSSSLSTWAPGCISPRLILTCRGS